MLENGGQAPSGRLSTILQHLRSFFVGFTTVFRTFGVITGREKRVFDKLLSCYFYLYNQWSSVLVLSKLVLSKLIFRSLFGESEGS